jgi:putative peptidoglycan lipid II flippase
MALSEPSIRVALQRGNFDVADTTLTAAALVLYGLSIPVWGAQQIYARGFYARRQMWTPVLVGTAGTVGAIPLFVWLSRPLGIPGLAAASTVSLTAYTVVLAAIWYRRTGSHEVWPVLYTLARSLVAGSVAGVTGWYVADLIAGPVAAMSFVDGFAALLAGGLAVAAIYLAISTAVGSTEMRDLLRRRSAANAQPRSPSGSS